MTTEYLTISKILRQLMFDRDIRPIDLARDLNMTAPTIHRIVTGQSKNPHKSSLQPIAEYFGITVDQLVGKEPIKPSTKDLVKLSSNNDSKIIKLILWEELDNLGEIHNHTEELVVADVSDKAFALVNHDHSMEPVFRKNTTLIFDPESPVTDRSYILIKLAPSGIYVFRQIIIDIEQKFIKSMNPDISTNSLRLINTNDTIIARLVEVRNKIL